MTAWPWPSYNLAITEMNYVFPLTERPEVLADSMVDSSELRPQVRLLYNVLHYLAYYDHTELN